VVAIPEFNKFLVHYEMALYSYPLNLVVRVSQGLSTAKTLEDSVERLAQKDGNILFFRAGRIANRTLVVYATKTFLHVTLHVLELIRPDENTQSSTDRRSSYRPFGSPMPIPRDARDARFLSQKVAICASKAIHILEPMNMAISSPTVIPNFSDPIYGGDVLKEKCDSAKVLGLMRSEKAEILVIYDEFGCYTDKRGKPARLAGYIPWECRATAYAHRGPHLLLFSPKFIEVRTITSGKLVQVIEAGDVRLLHSGLTEEDMLVAAMTGDVDDGSGLSEKILELVQTTAIDDTQESGVRVEEHWEEWDM